MLFVVSRRQKTQTDRCQRLVPAARYVVCNTVLCRLLAVLIPCPCLGQSGGVRSCSRLTNPVMLVIDASDSHASRISAKDSMWAEDQIRFKVSQWQAFDLRCGTACEWTHAAWQSMFCPQVPLASPIRQMSHRALARRQKCQQQHNHVKLVSVWIQGQAV